MENSRVTREEVERFLFIPNSDYGYGSGDGRLSGYGHGYGDGNDYGNLYEHCTGDGDGRLRGDGHGYGDGNGYGNLYGYGSGDGYGSGYGAVHGYGYGHGNGYGTGWGNGSGYGYGDDANIDIQTFNGNIVDYIDGIPTIIKQIHGNIACGYIIKTDLTLESCFIAKIGVSFAHGKTIKDAVADAKAKEMGRLPIKERVKKFIETFGSLDSEHTGKEFYNWHHILTGSCIMGRDIFCKNHNIDLTKKYTVRYFLNITKNDYGGNIINQVMRDYGIL